jgi:hypothetical protein
MGIYHRERRSPGSGVAELYERYRSFNGDTEPARTAVELQTVVLAAGMRHEDIGPSFWHSLRPDWLSGEQDLEPFAEAPGANEEYRCLASLRGLLPCCPQCGRGLQQPEQIFCAPPCARAWAAANAAAFTGAPLSLPEEHGRAFMSLLAGDAVEPAREAALGHWLDSDSETIDLRQGSAVRRYTAPAACRCASTCAFQ